MKLALGAGVALALMIMLYGRGSGDEPVTETGEASAPAVAESEPDKARPLSGGERPEIVHAEAWARSAEALGEVDKHLNRAKLLFADIDDAMARADAVSRKLRAQGTGSFSGDQPPQPPPAFDQGGESAAPTPAPAPDPALARRANTEREEALAEARAIWAAWKRDWDSDLAAAAQMLPDPGQVDARLLPGYTAVAQLVGMCRALPSGSPPTQALRAGWLRKLQNQSVAVRQELQNSR